MTKLKNSICDKTQKLKLWQNFNYDKSQFMTKNTLKGLLEEHFDTLTTNEMFSEQLFLILAMFIFNILFLKLCQITVPIPKPFPVPIPVQIYVQIPYTLILPLKKTTDNPIPSPFKWLNCRRFVMQKSNSFWPLFSLFMILLTAICLPKLYSFQQVLISTCTGLQFSWSTAISIVIVRNKEIVIHATRLMSN